jgi:hypothetical protein
VLVQLSCFGSQRGHRTSRGVRRRVDDWLSVVITACVWDLEPHYFSRTKPEARLQSTSALLRGVVCPQARQAASRKGHSALRTLATRTIVWLSLPVDCLATYNCCRELYSPSYGERPLICHYWQVLYLTASSAPRSSISLLWFLQNVVRVPRMDNLPSSGRWYRDVRSSAYCLLRRSGVWSPVSVLASTYPGTVPQIQICLAKNA